MDEKDKKIASLEKDVEQLKKQLAKAVKAINALDKKVNRVYHNHASTAASVQNLTSILRRIS